MSDEQNNEIPVTVFNSHRCQRNLSLRGAHVNDVKPTSRIINPVCRENKTAPKFRNTTCAVNINLLCDKDREEVQTTYENLITW